MKMKHYLVSVLLLWSVTLCAQSVRLTATISSSQVAAGEQFEVVFSTNADMEAFEPPSFNGFQVLGSPSQSSSYSSVNGVTTSSISISYLLMAVKEGVYSIGPAMMKSGGRQYRSNSLKLTIVKGSAVAPNSGGGNSGGADRGAANGRPADISKRVFIRAIPSKTSVYQGEQLSVTYKLYTNTDIVDLALDKMPDFNGFWSQEVKDKTQNVQGAQEEYNGARYNVAVLKEVILFPERSGKLPLDALAMTIVARMPVPSNDPIEDFFGGSYKDIKYKIRSAAVNINVKPLPENGKPEGFKGAVGDFSIMASVDKTALRANEALNYNLVVRGSGNLKLLVAPELNLPADIEKYDPKVADNFNETLAGVSGSREFNYLLIPRHEGKFKLQPLRFSYFNPAINRYVTLTTRDFDLDVAKGLPGSNVTSFSSGAQQDVKMLDKDIRYIKTDGRLWMPGDGFYGSLTFWLLLLAGPVLFVAAFFYRQQYRKNNKDQVLVRSRKASKIAAKHMANAQKQLDAGDKKLFYEAVYRGLYGYLGDKFNIPAADQNKEDIEERLRSAKINEALIIQLNETIEWCEMARYAPVSGISEQEVFDKAKGIINDIENA